jgi:hypothetical protein
MDDLYSLRATCSSMRRICGDPTAGQHLALDWVRHGSTGANPVNYYALLATLTHVSNPEACFLTGVQTVFMEKHRPQ